MEVMGDTLKVFQISLPISAWEEVRKYAAENNTTGPAILRELIAEWQRNRNAPNPQYVSKRGA